MRRTWKFPEFLGSGARSLLDDKELILVVHYETTNT